MNEIPIFSDDDKATIIINCSKDGIPGMREIHLEHLKSIKMFPDDSLRIEIVADWQGSEHNLQRWDVR